MGALLDLEDVAAGHPKAQKELAELYAFRDAIQGASMNPEKTLGEVVAGSGSALARDQLAELRKNAERVDWLVNCLGGLTGYILDRGDIDRAMSKSREPSQQSS